MIAELGVVNLVVAAKVQPGGSICCEVVAVVALEALIPSPNSAL